MAGIDIISDSTGKEIVAAIQSTDVAQARILEINTAAELKKNEVLESIPEDYSNIANEVSSLKGDLDNNSLLSKLYMKNENKIKVRKEFISRNMFYIDKAYSNEKYGVFSSMSYDSVMLKNRQMQDSNGSGIIFGKPFELEPNKKYTALLIPSSPISCSLLVVDSSSKPIYADAYTQITKSLNVDYYTTLVFTPQIDQITECRFMVYSTDNIGDDVSLRIIFVEEEYSDFDILEENSLKDVINTDTSWICDINPKIIENNIFSGVIANISDSFNRVEIKRTLPSTRNSFIINTNAMRQYATVLFGTRFNLKADTTYTIIFYVKSHMGSDKTTYFLCKSDQTAIQNINGSNQSIDVKNTGITKVVFTPNISEETSVQFAIYSHYSNASYTDEITAFVLEGNIDDYEIVRNSLPLQQIKFSPEKYGLPTLYLNGDISGMSKDNKKELSYSYKDRSGVCTLKWQGSSSIYYPKKNYTVTFDVPFEANDGWGEQQKYCLKANYIDFSHARNVVSAKLWGQIVKSRVIRNDMLYDLPNGGAVDGFPIMLVINGVYKGLYTFNIPKDKWMFCIDSESDTSYIVTAENHTYATKFKANALLDGSDFELEYQKEDDVETVRTSLNTMINACRDSTGTNYKDIVENYMDIDSAVDYYIFTSLLGASDNIDKNYILVTFDGVKWYMSAYDLDSTYGNYWDGKSYCNANTATPTFDSYNNTNRLMHLIYTYDKERLKARYNELRNTVMSESNILYMFSNFICGIPKALFDEEVKIWTDIPGTYTNNISQIIEWYRLRVKALDEEISNL